MANQRNDLKVEPGGFPVYAAKQLPKIDSMRRDKSLPDFAGVPVLRDTDVAFTCADELGDRPASCYTCKEQTSDMTCQRLGPGIKVEKVTGHRDSGNPIEYWPCCSLHEFCQDVADGKREKPHYHETLDTPASLGLVWINAPKVGQKFGGANCGGVNGGDDCDSYIVHGKTEKWEVEQAYCRVLAHEVEGGAVCSAWHDDDELPFAEAQMLIRGDSMDTMEKKRLVKSIIGRDNGER
jgi:hypothetical protein